MMSYSFQWASSRGVRDRTFWLVFLIFRLATGFVLIGPSAAAQAQVQVQMQTAIAGGTYQMPLGQDLSEATTSPRPVPIRIPGGVDALEQIKNQPATPAQDPVRNVPQPPRRKPS
jgi:hypothetical protein